MTIRQMELRTPLRGSPIVICSNREEVTRALAGFRVYRGVSQQVLDDIAGWTDGYTSKIEQPFSGGSWANRSGRCAMHSSFDEWLQSLKVCLVIVPRESSLTILGEDEQTRAIQIMVPREQHFNKLKKRKKIKDKRGKALAPQTPNDGALHATLRDAKPLYSTPEQKQDEPQAVTTTARRPTRQAPSRPRQIA